MELVWDKFPVSFNPASGESHDRHVSCHVGDSGLPTSRAGGRPGRSDCRSQGQTQANLRAEVERRRAKRAKEGATYRADVAALNQAHHAQLQYEATMALIRTQQAAQFSFRPSRTRSTP